MWQYIKDTRGEMRHVAWPTQTQTTIYTILVIAISALVAVYLGFFDFLFTAGMENVLGIIPQDVSVSPVGSELPLGELTSSELVITPSDTGGEPQNIPVIPTEQTIQF